MKTRQTDQNSVALVAMPWTMFNRPSIQLGALKAYTEAASPYQVDCYHPYLDTARAIGIDTYHHLAASGWAGEALFSALLFPEQADRAEQLFHSVTDGKKLSRTWKELLELTQAACSEWLESIEWNTYLAAGFSICFNQLLPSLYMASELKKRVGSLPVIFGGSSCGGELGSSLLEGFEQLDYIIDGEGEEPFVQLLDHLASPTKDLPERVTCRNHPGRAIPSPEIMDISELPVPDFIDYFKQIEHLFPNAPFIPEIPLEFSRGCWWNKCTFCNLNLQWQQYRWKTAEKMLEELKTQASRHKVLDFCFTDNALPPKEADRFFGALEQAPVDLRFFAEIRAKTTRDTLQRYSAAGLKVIQVGIESFSQTLLGRMKKGTTVIENIAAMRHAQETGIDLEGNLIVEFPGSTETEVQETLEILDFVEPFRPLSTASFFLGYGSPVHSCPEHYGIIGRTHHPKSRYLYPGDILTNLKLLAMDYRGDRTHQRKLWKPVVDKVERWHAFHKELSTRTTPPLSYRDGGSFLIIRQEKPGVAVQRHRLTGTSRAIYLFCRTIRTLEELAIQYPSFTPEALKGFIAQLCAKKLMFREDDKILSLAVHRH